MTTESGVLSETQYSFGTRFQEGIGTIAKPLALADSSDAKPLVVTRGDLRFGLE